MIKKYHLIIAAFFLVLFVVSCNEITFSPEKENNITVNRSVNNLEINLDSEADTVFAFGTAELKYTIDTKGKIFRRLIMYIDSAKIDQYYTDNKIYLNTEKYTDGMHTLKFEVWVNSGTGSIADRYSSEYIITTKQWNIFIDNRELSSPLKIDSIFTSGGKLKITWQKYPYLNFDKYVVSRALVADNGYTYDFYPIASIDIKNHNFWEDTTYIGGAYKYEIDAFSQKKITYGEGKFFNDEPTVLYSPEKVNNEKVILKWAKNKYYSNFKSYTVYRYNGDESGSRVRLAVIKGLADTSFTDMPGFGGAFTYYITVDGDIHYSTVYSESNRNKITVGDSFPPFGKFDYVPSANSIYIYTYENNCIRYNANTLQEENRGIGRVFLSNSGKYAYTNSQEISLWSHSFTKLDPLTLQVIGNTFTTESFMHYHSTNDYFVLLENGTCFYTGFRYNGSTEYGPPAVILLDMDPVKILQKDTLTLNNTFAVKSVSKLTEEGQYVLCNDNLVNIKNNSYSSLRKVSGTNACFTESGKEYISTKGNVLSVYKCSDNALLKSFPIETELLYPMLDPATGYVGGLVWSDNLYRIYDINDGKLVREIKLMNSLEHYMANSYLFSPQGYVMKLNFGQ